MNLKKLFEMQEQLDAHIEKEHPRKDGENRLSKKILALQVELGELANEWRGFKFWSNNQKPRDKYVEPCYECNGEKQYIEICHRCGGEGIEYEINPLLEEYVDCLHFILSIGNDLGFSDIQLSYIPKRSYILPSIMKLMKISLDLVFTSDLPRELYVHLVTEFIALGEMLGFTWEEIEQAYIAKNKINHERQEEGY